VCKLLFVCNHRFLFYDSTALGIWTTSSLTLEKPKKVQLSDMIIQRWFLHVIFDLSCGLFSFMILHCDDGIRHVEAVLEEPLYWVYLRTLSLEWNPHCKQFLPWSKFGAWRPFEDIKEEEPTDNIEYIISRYFRYNIIDPPLIVIVKCLCLLQDNKYSSFYGLLCFFAKKYWPFGFLLSIYWKFCR